MTTSPSSPHPPFVELDESALADVILVRCFEEADPEYGILSRTEREKATEAARPELGEGDPTRDALRDFLRARATPLAASLEKRVPTVQRLRGWGHRWPTLPICAGIALVGLCSNFLGASKQIHVVANPLMVLIVWNLLLYLLLFYWGLSGSRALGSWTKRLGSFDLIGRTLRKTSGEHEVVRTALAHYGAQRARASAPLFANRGRYLLHLGAIAVVLGALGGLYLRGLVLAYETTWESTFLTAETTQRALNALFALPSFLTGIAVPTLRATSAETSDAADWIHLYAVSVVLFVLLPRAILAWRAGSRARRLEAALPLSTEAAYFRRLASMQQGKGLDVLVVPYSHRLSARARDGLGSLLHDVFGARASVNTQEGVAYGAEASEVIELLDDRGARQEDGTHRLVLVFGLAQTPEAEVHARLISELSSHFPNEPALVVVDTSDYRERLGAGSTAEQRLQEHRRSWDRVLREVGVTALHLDLTRDGPDDLVERAGELVAGREERA